jgi:hypothetical protein
MMFEISIYDIYIYLPHLCQIFQIMSQGTVPQYSCPYKEATSQQSEMLKAAEMGGATPKL